MSIVRRRLGGDRGPCVALVAGLKGDAPAGIRVLYDVLGALRTLPALAGTVDVYPCANPVAVHGGTPTWPFFDVDLKRLFPGRPDGHPPDRVAHALTTHLKEADVVVEVDDAGADVRACVFARVRRGRAREMDLALRSGVPVVWERSPGPAPRGTFAAMFDHVIALRGGAGRRLDERTDAAMVGAVLGLLAAVGIVDRGFAPAPGSSVRVGDADVASVRVGAGGLFLPRCEPGARVSAGQTLGVVVDPVAGEELEVLATARAGLVLAVRDRPVVHPGSTAARIVTLPESA